jgi:hypothetical protein
VARTYKVEEEEVLRGNRGRENEARKVAMYLVRRCCDRTLEETAQVFGVGSYGTVGWASHGIQSKVEEEREFRDRVEKIIQRIYQPKDLTLTAHYDNISVVFTHHENKYGRGKDNEQRSNNHDPRLIRGAGSFFGTVDQALFLDHDHGGPSFRRRLWTMGRYGEVDRVIDCLGNPDLASDDSYEYQDIGGPDVVRLDTRREKLFPFLSIQPKGIDALVAESGIPALRKILELLLKEGQIIREGKGVSGKPYMFRLPGVPGVVLIGHNNGSEPWEREEIRRLLSKIPVGELLH